LFDTVNISKGNVWTKDDGIELAISGKTHEGNPRQIISSTFLPIIALKALPWQGPPRERCQTPGKRNLLLFYNKGKTTKRRRMAIPKWRYH